MGSGCLYVVQFEFDASRRGKKVLIIILETRMKTRTVVGRGEKGMLSDPGSELLLGGRARVLQE